MLKGLVCRVLTLHTLSSKPPLLVKAVNATAIFSTEFHLIFLSLGTIYEICEINLR